MTDINARIAVKKGWTIRENEAWVMWQDERGMAQPLPQYTTDWRLAGGLLEEMATAGLEPDLRYDDSLGWMLDWQPQTTTSFGMKVSADTPQMAIALAWLEWSER